MRSRWNRPDDSRRRRVYYNVIIIISRGQRPTTRSRVIIYYYSCCYGTCVCGCGDVVGFDVGGGGDEGLRGITYAAFVSSRRRRCAITNGVRREQQNRVLLARARYTSRLDLTRVVCNVHTTAKDDGRGGDVRSRSFK